MSETHFVLGDWGTSRLRLFLCAQDDALVETCEGPGIGRLMQSPEDTLFELIAPWQGRFSIRTVTLAGMVGSNIGWRNVSYMTCPAGADALMGGAARFVARGLTIEIIAGMTCRNALGSPDVMRGEETQIFGALQLYPALKQGRHLICLPGTHTKWALLDEGRLAHFHTAPTGEFFDILTKYSVLTQNAGPITAVAPEAFLAGVDKGLNAQSPGLMHYLFETRSKQITGDFTEHEAGSWLSGLLIGHDVAGARAIYGDSMASVPVTLIGAEALNALYLDALDKAGLSGVAVSGNEAVVAGLKLLRTTEAAHAGV